MALPKLQAHLRVPGWRRALRKVCAILSWAAQAWAKEAWTSTRDWSRDERDRRVGKVNDVKLSPGAKLVLLALADRADKDTHSCWPAKERLAHDTGLGVSAVKGALKQLVNAGLVEREPRYQDGRRSSDLYTLLIPPAWLRGWEGSRESESDQKETESNPEPTQEPSVSHLPLTEEAGSGLESTPLAPTCERCGCYLRRARAFETYCDPCEEKVAKDAMQRERVAA